ncbi:MAG: aspartate kinase [Deltaproteobacteria bacterium]|nr:aspartate kinase [Deltaproteobacteria bacterium]
MKILVQKYGGSSVADISRLRRVAERVVAAKRAGYAVCVVVSAMGKATDQLLAQASEVSAAPPRRELDMLLSVGERTTMALLAIALHALGEDAISFTGSQCGIMTNDRHFDARIIEVRPFRIEDELARGRIVIVAGYQGMSYKREITTLGRGGSDTTAVALAAALSAERCEIYSDVDGVYSADPRVVDDARHLGELGYEELQEMAEAGAKVLNAEAVEFAKRHRIAIYARRTDDPVEGGRETVVRLGVVREASGVRAVVSEAKIAYVRAVGPSLAAVLGCCGAQGVPVKELHSSGNSLGFVVSLARVPDWAKGRAALEALGDGVMVREDLGAVSLVGDGITRDVRVLSRMQEVLETLGVAVESLVTTAFRISVLVDRAQLDALTRALHAEFVASDGANVALESQ